MTPKLLRTLKEYSEALFIALILAFFIRSFVVQAFKIPSGSMLQTLQIGDHLLVNKFIYGLKLPFTDIIMVPIDDPEFQDIIVFEYPEDPSKDFIKRVIGLPGDTISIKNKEVYRNGKPLNEPYVQHTSASIVPLRDNMPEITVPTGKYFVMGDNRDNSHDSRFWGFVDRDTIKGKAWIIYWSWTGPFNIRWNNIGKLVH
jgi:signal peptidase I